MVSEEQLRKALGPVVAAFESDGYRLSPEIRDDGSVTIRITTLDNACADCLVGEPAMRSILDGVLRDGGIDAMISRIVYPQEQA